MVIHIALRQTNFCFCRLDSLASVSKCTLFICFTFWVTESLFVVLLVLASLCRTVSSHSCHVTVFAGDRGGRVGDGALLGRLGPHGADVRPRRAHARPVLQDHPGLRGECAARRAGVGGALPESRARGVSVRLLRS